MVQDDPTTLGANNKVSDPDRIRTWVIAWGTRKITCGKSITITPKKMMKKI